MAKHLALLVCLPFALSAQFNTTLSSKTTAAFESYLRTAEPRIDGHAHYSQLKPGEVRVDPVRGDGSINIADGIVHDWVAATFVTGVKPQDVIAVLQNYPSYKSIYAPDVTESRLLDHSGDHWRPQLRIVQKKVLTVVLNTEYDVVYRDLNAGRWLVISRSTRIAEIDGDRELPVGTGHGFLWRLNAYWVIEPRDGGVYLECRSLSLSRDIPFGLGFVVSPFVSSLPPESLRATLEKTAWVLRSDVAARGEHPTVAQNKVDDRSKRNRE